MGFLLSATVFLVIVIMSSLKVIMEYQRGVVLTLGKYTGIRSPGLRIVVPIIQKMYRVDLRTRVIDVPDQDCITKDNVSVNVNAVLYYKVNEANKAIINVEHYEYAISQNSQTTMRDVVGEVTLDELLSKRDQLSARIQQLVDKATDQWGIKVSSVDLKHIQLPQNMKRAMAKEAEAEREKRAVIIKADGELQASGDMSKAATMLATAEGALHLRSLQTLNDMASDQSNSIHFVVPLEVLNAIEVKSGGRWQK